MSNLFKTKANPAVTTGSSTTAPWGPAQGPLQTALTGAQNLYNSDTGYKPWTKSVNADQSGDTLSALSGVRGVASGAGQTLGNTSLGFANNLISSGGIDSRMQPGIDALKETISGKYLTADSNPYLKDMLAANDADISNQVAQRFSASGRYGSGSFGGALGKALTTANLGVLSSNYNNERDRQLSAASGLADIIGTGSNRALGAAQNGQAITDQLYDPFGRLAGVGQVADDRAQADLNNTMSNWDAQESRPWDMLARLNAIATGAGQLGGTKDTVQVAPGQSNLQKTLGYTTSGLGLLGLLGGK